MQQAKNRAARVKNRKRKREPHAESAYQKLVQGSNQQSKEQSLGSAKANEECLPPKVTKTSLEFHRATEKYPDAASQQKPEDLAQVRMCSKVQSLFDAQCCPALLTQTLTPHMRRAVADMRRVNVDRLSIGKRNPNNPFLIMGPTEFVNEQNAVVGVFIPALLDKEELQIMNSSFTNWRPEMFYSSTF